MVQYRKATGVESLYLGEALGKWGILPATYEAKVHGLIT